MSGFGDNGAKAVPDGRPKAGLDGRAGPILEPAAGPTLKPVVASSCLRFTPGYLVNPSKKRYFRAGCMCWRCTKCKRVLAYRVRKRLEPIRWTAKIELTLDGDNSPTRENNLRLARGTRNLLQFARRHFRRQYGEDFNFRFARMHGVGERKGGLHSHLVWDAPYIPQAELSAHAQACGLGYVVWIRAVDNRHHADAAAKYVADQAVGYVANQAAGSAARADLPLGCRRFQSSGVPAYEGEPGWHWQECTPDLEWDPNSYEAGLKAAMLLGNDARYLGSLTLLVKDGETASPPGAHQPKTSSLEPRNHPPPLQMSFSGFGAKILASRWEKEGF